MLYAKGLFERLGFFCRRIEKWKVIFPNLKFSKTKNQKPKTKNQKPKTKNQKPKTNTKLQEDFLHYVWKFQKFKSVDLKSTDGNLLSIVKVGEHNQNSGPDFFNSHLRFAGQLWAGNVEIHINSSDWYIHNHENDSNYDNVILHVVWNHDADIHRKDNSAIPTLELKNIVDEKVAHKYYELMANKNQFINCERDFRTVDDFTISHWLERLYFERLERKSEQIFELLKKSNNDWEAVFFKMIAKNFGLKVNGDPFFSMANSIDFSVIRKLSLNRFQLEALFFGQSHLLNYTSEIEYERKLVEEYKFLKTKFKLDNSSTLVVNFFRLRPPNFPTIRLSQLATLYHHKSAIFSQIQNLQTYSEIQTLLKVEASNFWKTHYTFATDSRFSKKQISTSFIDLLIINTIIPIKFSYHKSLGVSDNENLIALAEMIPAEKNSIIERFMKLRPIDNNSKASQALLQLKKNYCDVNLCLHCEIGNHLIKN
ncbi:Protein of unknown function [Flavobacteriaceae bacterium MAR_2010_188]|nr:Protein of unknown function [Flavobacteriaceae bacterium MAR_2010_188]